MERQYLKKLINTTELYVGFVRKSNKEETCDIR